MAAPYLSDLRSENAAARVGDDGWKRFESRRDPAAASHARDEEALRKRGPDRKPNPAAVNAAKRAAADQYRDRDLDWIRREDAGEPLADIARSDSVPHSWVTGAVARARERYDMPLPETVKQDRLDHTRQVQQASASARAEAVRARDDEFLRRREAGETARQFANDAGLSESAVSYGVRRARKRRDG